MNRYEIRCTPGQTKKALKLGAPLRKFAAGDTLTDSHWVSYNNAEIYTPTVEQMIGWLEEQRIAVDITTENSGYEWSVWVKKEHCLHYSFIEENDRFYPSRKEATLAAIDAALEYLIKNKK